MALQVNASFINQLFNSFLNSNVLGANPKLEIFKGEIPEVDGNFVFNSANYTADKLAQLNGFNLQILNRTIRFGTAPPAPINATATGTASWFALSNSSSPTYAGNAILGTITNQIDGTGVLILENVNLIQDVPFNTIEIGIRVF